MTKTINGLMKHMRDCCGIAIGGSSQKKELRRMGYYHGYKGLRFAGKAANRLPITDFTQVSLLYDLDMQMKGLLYPYAMEVETALKNYTLEVILAHSRSEDFERIWSTCLTGYRHQKPGSGQYRQAWQKRQRLKRNIDETIYQRSNDRDVIRHFMTQDQNVPIWALFEGHDTGRLWPVL